MLELAYLPSGGQRGLLSGRVRNNETHIRFGGGRSLRCIAAEHRYAQSTIIGASRGTVVFMIIHWDPHVAAWHRTLTRQASHTTFSLGASEDDLRLASCNALQLMRFYRIEPCRVEGRSRHCWSKRDEYPGMGMTRIQRFAPVPDLDAGDAF
jgi:hypothetical protein